MVINKTISIPRWLRVLSLVNTLLTVAIVLVCAYILISPWKASVENSIKAIQDPTKGFVYQTKLSSEFSLPENKLKPIPKQNWLVVPKIFVDGPISEGQDKEALDRGYWNRSFGRNPIDGNNMVLVGHRNLANWMFADLDKLVTGDVITVYWQGEEYNYRVAKMFEVTPEQIEIEAETSTKQLTLYTCTPVLTAERRLVVVAYPA